MSNPEMMEALSALAIERGITVETLFGALADALESAYKRMPDSFEYSWVTIDPESTTRNPAKGARPPRQGPRPDRSTSNRPAGARVS